MEDLDFDEMLTSTDIKEEAKKDEHTSNSSNKDKEPRLYTDTNIMPKDITKLKFKNTTTKTFTVYDNGKIPDDKLELLKKVANGLFSKGYIYRSPDDTKSKTDEAIRAIEGARVKLFKPFSKFTGSDQGYQVESKETTRLAYEIACGVKKNFIELKDIIRCFYARTVQTLLGKDCDDPSNILIIYTPEGTTTFSKAFKVENAGNVIFPMQIAIKSNIPICNLGSDKFLEDLKTILTATGSTGTMEPEVKQKVQEEPKQEVTEEPKKEEYLTSDMEDIW
nr:MAG TPA: hypothetical protein [Caudoviricetes sp.]